MLEIRNYMFEASIMATDKVVVFWWAHKFKKSALKGQLKLVGRIDRKQ